MGSGPPGGGHGPGRSRRTSLLSDGHGYEFDVFLSHAVENAGSPDAGAPATGTDALALFRNALGKFGGKWLKRELTIADAADGASPEQAAAFVAVLSPAYLEDIDVFGHAVEYLASRGDREPVMFTAIRDEVPRDSILEDLRDVRTYALHDDAGMSPPGLVMSAASSLAKDLAAALEKAEGSTNGPAPDTTDAETSEGTGARAIGPDMAAAETNGAGPRPDPETAGPAVASGPRPAGESGRSVFLAHTEPALQEYREDLRRALLDRGYRVVPEGPARAHSARLEAETTSALEGCEISVHILGATYDDAAALEAEIAGERSAAGGLTRFVWLAAGRSPDDGRLRRLYASIEDSPAGTEPIRNGPLQTFQTHVLDHLERARRVREPLSGDAPFVYVHYDGADAKWGQRVQGLLRRHRLSTGREIEIVNPLLGDVRAAQIAEDRRWKLADCDVCVVLWGSAPAAWMEDLRRELHELRRIEGRKTDVRFVFLPPEEDEAKHVFIPPWGPAPVRPGEKVLPGEVLPLIEIATGNGAGA